MICQAKEMPMGTRNIRHDISHSIGTRLGGVRGLLTAGAAALAMLQPAPATAQPVACPVKQDLVKIPEIVSQDGKLRGTILLSDEQQYIAFRAQGTIPGGGPN